MARLFGFSLVLALARRVQKLQKKGQAICIDDDEALGLLAANNGYQWINSCAAQGACTEDGEVGTTIRRLCCATCSASKCDWENDGQYIDLEYGSNHGTLNSTQTYDLHTTKAASFGPVPLAVYVHGGSWKGGSKSEQMEEFMALRQRGFHVANINYRLSPPKDDEFLGRLPLNFRHPGHIKDLELAFDYFKSEKFVQTYNIDPGKIVAIGSSAGGHLVSLLGTRPGSAARVAAVVNFFGPLVLTASSDPVFNYLGCNTMTVGSDCYQRAVEASPVYNVSAEIPPFLSFYGTNDRSYDTGVMFQDAGETAGADTTFHSVECPDHDTCHNKGRMLKGTTNGMCNTDVMYTWIYKKLGLSVAGCIECP